MPSLRRPGNECCSARARVCFPAGWLGIQCGPCLPGWERAAAGALKRAVITPPWRGQWVGQTRPPGARVSSHAGQGRRAVLSPPFPEGQRTGSALTEASGEKEALPHSGWGGFGPGRTDHLRPVVCSEGARRWASTAVAGAGSGPGSTRILL